MMPYEYSSRVLDEVILTSLSGLLTHVAATESVFLARADEKLTAFLELETAIRDKESQSHRPC
jgi:hypothetical protein